MSRSPTNPPAFPQSDYSDEHWVVCQGLSMRDYFAAPIMASFTAGIERFDQISPQMQKEFAEKLAKLSYFFADAMLAAREK